MGCTPTVSSSEQQNRSGCGGELSLMTHNGGVVVTPNTSPVVTSTTPSFSSVEFQERMSITNGGSSHIGEGNFGHRGGWGSPDCSIYLKNNKNKKICFVKIISNQANAPLVRGKCRLCLRYRVPGNVIVLLSLCQTEPNNHQEHCNHTEEKGKGSKVSTRWSLGTLSDTVPCSSASGTIREVRQHVYKSV